MPTPLTGDELAVFEASPLTYDEVGATRTGDIPPGMHHFRRSHHLRRRDFEAAADELLGWQVQERSGLDVAASTPRAAVGTVVRMSLGVRPFRVTIPCRVVHVVDDPDRQGFAYGTLPGHPERGEEQFLLERTGDGLLFTVEAFSRPATLLARAGGPATRRFQRFMTSRYLTALDR